MLKQLGRWAVAVGALSSGILLGAGLRRRTVTPAVVVPEVVVPAAETPPAYETRDLDPGQLVRIAVGFVVVLGMIGLLMVLLQFWWMGYTAPFQAQAPSLVPPPGVTLPAQPRFEAVPGTAFQQVQTRADLQLTTYGWINQSTGTVHIPIQRAMQLTVQEGLPVAPQDVTNTFETAGNLLPSSSSSGRVLEPVAP